MKKIRKEKIAGYKAELQKHIDQHHFLRIERSFHGRADYLNGFVIQLSAKFLLMQPDRDFELDGYCILPIDGFDDYRYAKYERAFKKIYQGEGVYPRDYGMQPAMELTDWAGIFKELKRRDYHVIVECENQEDPGFYIGPIVRVNAQSVVMQFYDATGQLKERLDLVKFANITLVTFGDRYTTVLRKYLKGVKG